MKTDDYPFKTMGEAVGFIYHRSGADALKEALTEMASWTSGKALISREALMEASQELAAIGLNEPAEICAGIQAPLERDIHSCYYLMESFTDPEEHNRKCPQHRELKKVYGCHEYEWIKNGCARPGNSGSR